MKTFQEILRTLTHFWEKQGCVIHQGYDLEVGAGTFNPATFLRCLGQEPYRAAYIEPSRRPADGRFGENPIRMQHYFQYQVMLKPSPPNILDLYLESLEAIGFDLSKHDIRFVHDDWEQPTIGASGLGWEVWMDGMEVTQFTYFQQVGGQELKPITGEITYGIERLSTFLQGVDSTFKLMWSEDVNYGDIYKRGEFEWSHYNFEEADTGMWLRHFEDYEREAKRLIERKLPLPAYDFVMKASHAFNIQDARGAISVSERSGFISRIRTLACLVAESYIKSREEQGFPLMKRFANRALEVQKPLPPLQEPLIKPKPGQRDDFLLEIGVEELPATFVPIGVEGLEKALKNFLETHQIPYKRIHAYGTPRRLALLVEGLAFEKPAQVQEKKGPPLNQAYDEKGTLMPAGSGFFRALEVAPHTIQEVKLGQVKGVEIRSVKGIDYLFAEIRKESQSVAALLREELPGLILKIDFPKKMRWGTQEIAFARPLRWLVALFGDYVLPFSIGTLIADRLSFGHRQLANHSFPISSPGRYLDLLRAHYVLSDIKEREMSIVLQLNAIEQELGGKAICREKVIPQVLHLVEWPTLTYATFDKNYLKTPREVLICEMVEHQKYFPVEEKEGNLKNAFVITANNTPSDLIRQGNQNVLSARLKDGTFLFEQDLKIPLEAFNEKLKTVTFLKGLGSIYEKAERLNKHAEILLHFLPIADKKIVGRAAHLSKADLVSGVVYEFPELQGTMGRIYATWQKEGSDVAESIAEHWMPKGEHAPLPKTPAGTILSLADKIDNLISCFGMNLKPSSSSDPYALRRQVLGIIRILIQGRLRIPLREVIDRCLQHFPKLLIPRQELLEEIWQFIQNRIKTVFLDYDLSKDEIEASLSSEVDDVYDLFCRITALHDFRKNRPEFPSLYEVYRRAKGQVPNGRPLPFSRALLKESSEEELYSALLKAETNLSRAVSSQNYPEAYAELAALQPRLAKLFEEVKILDDDPKMQQNRLALLQKVFGLFGQLVDFGKIQC